MPTSSLYAFNPQASDLVIEAFDRIQIRPSELTPDHIVSARRSLNLVQVRWANRGVNLWAVDLQTVALVKGTATYTVPAETVQVLDVYLRLTASTTDRYLMPISRNDFAAIPNKTQQAPPTVYWYDRLIAPTITLWPVPDLSTTYSLQYYRVRQMQDASPQGGLAAEVPYRFLEALNADLAAHLAIKWKPEVAPALMTYAQGVWDEASSEDRERVSTFIVPQFDSYFR